MYIIRAFMTMRYRPGKKGRPNVLVLSKAMEGPSQDDEEDSGRARGNT
jgi:hypothetical protein